AYDVDATWSAIVFWFPGLQGDVLVVLGARRRWPFRREDPNGSALLLEVPMVFSMLPSPCGCVLYRVLGWSPRGLHQIPSSAENMTAIEVAMMSRPARPPQHHRDALERRDLIATAWAAAIVSRQGWASQQGRDGPMRRDYNRGMKVLRSETSQQQQVSRLAEETGR
ncbi:hypothetical protein Taro_031325, partial [Colocasia esculenta]|nr:hypothetical protein [Colocasia esculenta]